MAPLAKAFEIRDRGFLSFEGNDLAVECCENRLCGNVMQSIAPVDDLADSPLFAGVAKELLN